MGARGVGGGGVGESLTAWLAGMNTKRGDGEEIVVTNILALPCGRSLSYSAFASASTSGPKGSNPGYVADKRREREEQESPKLDTRDEGKRFSNTQLLLLRWWWWW